MLMRFFKQSRVPLSFFALLAVIIGIATYHFLKTVAFFISICVWAIYLCFFVISFTKQKTSNPWPCIMLIFFTLGLVRYYSIHEKIELFYRHYASQELSFYGTVIDKKESACSFCPHCLTISLQKINTSKYTDPPFNISTWDIQLFYKNTDNIQVGDSISYTQKMALHEPKKSFKDYLLKTGTLATFFNPSPKITCIERPSFSFYRTIFETKRYILEQAKKTLSPYTFELFASLFLGYRNGEKNKELELIDNFKSWGIVHLIARSGIHLTIITGLWQTFLCTVPLPFALKEIILMIIVLGYALLSWTSLSFLRAIYTFFLCKIIIVMGRGYHFLHILTVLALAMLLYCPTYLFFLDFQLSFGLTYAIAWLNNQKNSF